MFKCVNCGHIFEEGEQAVKSDRHGFRYGPAEEYSACPLCGCTDLDRTVRCRKCGGEYLEEEMHGSICDECVTDAINYDSFLEFATSNARDSDDSDVLEDFIFKMIFHVKTPSLSSYDLKQECREIYQRRVATEKLLRSNDLVGNIRDYMSSWAIRDDFADWLEEKEANK